MRLSHASLTPDELVRRHVELVRADLDPDPLFRRRLRGVVTNRFVATREGLAQPVERPTQMGKVGRACLYASFALAMSVGGALAASRGAVPGDLLYPMKLQVEAIRLQTFPQQFHDDLLVYALGERVAEFGRLVEEGDFDRAAVLAQAIGAGYHQLAESGVDVGSEELRASLAVLEALTDRLPAPAQAAIQRAVNEAPGLAGVAPGLNGATSDRGAAPAPTSRGASTGRPAVVPADERSAAPSNRASTVAPDGPPAQAPPHASEPPRRGVQPHTDDEPASDG